jgi:SAM-dependent methyltransferase
MANELSDRDVALHWNENAETWAAHVRKGWDVFREYYNNPAFLEFVGDLNGKLVLDAGCGEGYNTRIFARRGARVTGVDLSPRMLEFAREEERREPLGVRYELASYTAMPMFTDESFDGAVSTMALMDGPDFRAAMREVCRVLKRGCDLVFSILHPCFATKGMGWIRTENGEDRLTVGHYFDDAAWVERWRFGAAPNAQQNPAFAVPRFDRTLSFYINNLIESGFTLREIREPRVTEEAVAAHPAFAKWRAHVPLFIYFRATKS